MTRFDTCPFKGGAAWLLNSARNAKRLTPVETAITTTKANAPKHVTPMRLQSHPARRHSPGAATSTTRDRNNDQSLRELFTASATLYFALDYLYVLTAENLRMILRRDPNKNVLLDKM